MFKSNKSTEEDLRKRLQGGGKAEANSTKGWLFGVRKEESGTGLPPHVAASKRQGSMSKPSDAGGPMPLLNTPRGGGRQSFIHSPGGELLESVGVKRSKEYNHNGDSLDIQHQKSSKDFPTTRSDGPPRGGISLRQGQGHDNIGGLDELILGPGGGELGLGKAEGWQSGPLHRESTPSKSLGVETEEDLDFQEREAAEQYLMELLRGKQVQMIRERLISRLIFEREFVPKITQCFCFLVNLILLTSILHFAYPSGEINIVHDTILKHYDLPLNVKNLDELNGALRTLAIKSRYFSPGSTQYTTDHLSRTYLPIPTKFPPEITVPKSDEPKLLMNMTITAWVQSSARMDKIVEKRRYFSGGSQICWSFHLEKVLYGEHETSKIHRVINPLASRIYKEGASEDVEWRQSAIRRKYNTGGWHHFAVTVENSIDFTFAVDGELTTTRHGAYALRDCDDGSVYLGSSRAESRMSSVTFFPRILSQAEIRDVMEIGLPLGNFLAASSPPTVQGNLLATLDAWSKETTVSDKASEVRIKKHTTETVRYLSKLIVNPETVTTTSANNVASGNNSTTPSTSSGGGYRMLSGTTTFEEELFYDQIKAQRRLLESPLLPFENLQESQNDNVFPIEARMDDKIDDDVGFSPNPSFNSKGKNTKSLRARYEEQEARKNRFLSHDSSDGNAKELLTTSVIADGRELAAVAVAATTTQAEFSPKVEYNKKIAADFSTCVNKQHHTCDLVMLHGVKKRLSSVFAQAIEGMESGPGGTLGSAYDVSNPYDNWCTRNIGKQDHVNYKYTRDQCFKLIGGFKNHAQKSKYAAGGGSLGASGTTGNALALLSSLQSSYQSNRRLLDDGTSYDRMDDDQFVGADFTNLNSMNPLNQELEDSTTIEKKRNLAGATTPGGTTTTIASLASPPENFYHPVDSVFGRLMKCMHLPNDITAWIDNSDQLAHSMDSINNKNASYAAEAALFEGKNTVFDKYAQNKTFYYKQYWNSSTTDIGWETHIKTLTPYAQLTQAQKDSPDYPKKQEGGTTTPETNVDFVSINCTDELMTTDMGGTLNSWEKHWIEHHSLVYFRYEEYYQCTHEEPFKANCAKDCGTCGIPLSPSTDEVLDVILDCGDDMTFRDWEYEGCEWYNLHDYGCKNYATAAVKAKCKLSCDLCNTAEKTVLTYDLDKDNLINFYEMNAFFVAVREPQHTVTLHIKKSMITFLCCNKIFGSGSEFASTCDPLEHDGLLYDDAIRYLELSFAHETPAQFATFKSTAHSSIQGIEYKDRHKIPQLFIDPCVIANFDDTKGRMQVELLTDKTSGFRKSVDDGIDTFRTLLKETRPLYAKNNAESLNAVLFDPVLHMPGHSAMPMEQLSYVYKPCSSHNDCTIADYANSPDVYPHACSMLEDPNDIELLITPNKCTRYDKRHYLFCSNRCLTGACGKGGDVEWGATNKEVGVAGFCQPCNGCDAKHSIDSLSSRQLLLSLGGNSTSSGNSGNNRDQYGRLLAADGRSLAFDPVVCPSWCAKDADKVPEHHAANPRITHSANAIGGWSLAMWIKGFAYQWLFRKQMHFEHDHPNHRWEGYTVRTIQLEHGDLYFPPGCEYLSLYYAPLSESRRRMNLLEDSSTPLFLNGMSRGNRTSSETSSEPRNDDRDRRQNHDHHGDLQKNDGDLVEKNFAEMLDPSIPEETRRNLASTVGATYKGIYKAVDPLQTTGTFISTEKKGGKLLGAQLQFRHIGDHDYWVLTSTYEPCVRADWPQLKKVEAHYAANKRRLEEKQAKLEGAQSALDNQIRRMAQKGRGGGNSSGDFFGGLGSSNSENSQSDNDLHELETESEILQKRADAVRRRLDEDRKRELAAASMNRELAASYSSSTAQTKGVAGERIIMSWRATDRESPYKNPLKAEDALWGPNLIPLTGMPNELQFYKETADLAKMITVHAKGGDLTCWRMEYDQLCFRNKWYERKLTCVKNPFAKLFRNSAAWHHLVIEKKAEQWTEYDDSFNPPRPVYSDREDHLEFIVDGERAILGLGLESGMNAVPPFGLPDCGGPLKTVTQIHAKNLDYWVGKRFSDYNKPTHLGSTTGTGEKSSSRRLEPEVARIDQSDLPQERGLSAVSVVDDTTNVISTNDPDRLNNSLLKGPTTTSVSDDELDTSVSAPSRLLGGATASVSSTTKITKAHVDALHEFFPMERVLPLGGEKTITAFTFEGIEVSAGAILHESHLEMCAADLVSSLYYENLDCQKTVSTSTSYNATLGQMTMSTTTTTTTTEIVSNTVELEIYGLMHLTTIDEVRKAEDPCYMLELFQQHRTPHKVVWRVPVSAWNLDAVFARYKYPPRKSSVSGGGHGDTKDGATHGNTQYRRAGHHSCDRKTPNIAPIVNDILEQSSWTWMGALTVFVIQKGQFGSTDTEIDSYKCKADSDLDNPKNLYKHYTTQLLPQFKIEEFLKKAKTGCDVIEHLRKPLIDNFPLWATPFEDRSNPDGKLVHLVVTWCMNRHCVSPQFLGGGNDVKYNGKDAISENEVYALDNKDLYAQQQGRNTSLVNEEICYSYIDGSEYDCRRRCPSQDYSKDWDIIGTFDCANKEHVAAFENAKQAYLQFKSLQQSKLEAMTNVQYLDTFGTTDASSSYGSSRTLEYNTMYNSAAGGIGIADEIGVSDLGYLDDSPPIVNFGDLKRRLMTQIGKSDWHDDILNSIPLPSEDLNSYENTRKRSSMMKIADQMKQNGLTNENVLDGNRFDEMSYIIPRNLKDIEREKNRDSENMLRERSGLPRLREDYSELEFLPPLQDPDPLSRRRLAGAASSGNSLSQEAADWTSLEIGELAFLGLPMTGVAFDVRYVDRAMSTSEVQNLYYDEQEIVINLPGPSRILKSKSSQIGAAAAADAASVASAVDSDVSLTQMTIKQYKPELVSVIPPVILQVRTKAESCEIPSPGKITHSLNRYLHYQVELPCAETYNCVFPKATLDHVPEYKYQSGYICRDQDKSIAETHTDTKYWAKSVVHVPEVGYAYPEFLDMYTVDTIYRERIPHPVVEWVDALTHDITVMNVFYSPIRRLATVVKIEWIHQGSGNFKESHTLQSFIQMSANTQWKWLILGVIWLSINFFEFFLLWKQVSTMYKRRLHWIGRMAKSLEDNPSTRYRRDPMMLQRIYDKVSGHTPLYDSLDVFTCCLRIGLIIFWVLHVLHYYTDDIGDTRMGRAENNVMRILEIPWPTHDILYEQKVKMFFDALSSLKSWFKEDELLKDFVQVLQVIYFLRMMLFLKIHPRIALLYSTLKKASDPLLHFTMVCILLLSQLGFLAYWAYGSEYGQYSSAGKGFFYAALMVNNVFFYDNHKHINGRYAVFIIICIILLQIIVTNIIRAIIINAFAIVTRRAGLFTPEGYFMQDVWHCFVTFPWKKRKYKWFDRDQIVEKLVDLGRTQDEITMTVLPDGLTVVDQHVLKACKLFDTEEEAEKFLAHFATVNKKMVYDESGHQTRPQAFHDSNLYDFVELHDYCWKLEAPSSTYGKTTSSGGRTQADAQSAAAPRKRFLDLEEQEKPNGLSSPSGGAAALAPEMQEKITKMESQMEDTAAMMRTMKKLMHALGENTFDANVKSAFKDIEQEEKKEKDQKEKTKKKKSTVERPSAVRRKTGNPDASSVDIGSMEGDVGNMIEGRDPLDSPDARPSSSDGGRPPSLSQVHHADRANHSVVSVVPRLSARGSISQGHLPTLPSTPSSGNTRSGLSGTVINSIRQVSKEGTGRTEYESSETIQLTRKGSPDNNLLNKALAGQTLQQHAPNDKQNDNNRASVATILNDDILKDIIPKFTTGNSDDTSSPASARLTSSPASAKSKEKGLKGKKLPKKGSADHISQMSEDLKEDHTTDA